MHTLRTRFKKEIVAEFLPPARSTKKQKVIIFADGMPTVPNKKQLLEFYSKKGFWVFHPRYRGSWESDGKFLAKSPHQDILDVIEGIETGFRTSTDFDYTNTKKYSLKPDQIILIGGSFGGPAVLIPSLRKEITKVIAISPVINWLKPGKDEPLDKLIGFVNYGFGNGYRISKNGWKKIASGKFYNPVNHTKEIDGNKVLIIHAKDDTVCPYSEAKKFATATKSKLITLPKGGHLSSSLMLTPRFDKEFRKLIKQK